MSTVSCPKCNKHGQIQPIKHPSDKEKPYFKCGDCGALFDNQSAVAKLIGTGLGGAAAAALAIFGFLAGG